MSESWRVVDTGLRPAAQNIALSRALLESRRCEEVPSTLRFSRYTPSALLAARQSAEQEFNLEFCRAHGVAIQRRITAGSAIYTNETQLDWELHLHRRELGSMDMRVVAKRICHAVATAVSALGIDARFRPRDVIDVDGRRIHGGGGAIDGNALLYQGMLFIDLGAEEILSTLRSPIAELSDAAVSAARRRYCNLNDLLGHRADPALVRRYLTEAFESEFSVEFRDADLTLAEHARYQAALAEIDTPAWVDLVRSPASEMPIYQAQHKYSGGMLGARLVYDRPRHRIRQVWFYGDLEVRPQRNVADLEAALCDTSVELLEHHIRAFFSGRPSSMPLLVPEDFIAVTRLAVKQPIVAQS